MRAECCLPKVPRLRVRPAYPPISFPSPRPPPETERAAAELAARAPCTAQVVYLAEANIPPESGPPFSGRLNAINTPFVFLSVLVISTAFHSTLSLHVLLESPFGRRRHDI